MCSKDQWIWSLGIIHANVYGSCTLVLVVATTREYGRRSQSTTCSRDLSFETLILEIFLLKFSKFLKKICSLEIFPMKIYSLEIFLWKFEIFFFFLKSYLEDLSFKHLKKKILKRFIHRDFSFEIWRFFLEDSFWRFFHCNFEKL